MGDEAGRYSVIVSKVPPPARPLAPPVVRRTDAFRVICRPTPAKSPLSWSGVCQWLMEIANGAKRREVKQTRRAGGPPTSHAPGSPRSLRSLAMTEVSCKAAPLEKAAIARKSHRHREEAAGRRRDPVAPGALSLARVGIATSLRCAQLLAMTEVSCEAAQRPKQPRGAGRPPTCCASTIAPLLHWPRVCCTLLEMRAGPSVALVVRHDGRGVTGR